MQDASGRDVAIYIARVYSRKLCNFIVSACITDSAAAVLLFSLARVQAIAHVSLLFRRGWNKLFFDRFVITKLFITPQKQRGGKSNKKLREVGLSAGGITKSTEETFGKRRSHRYTHSDTIDASVSTGGWKFNDLASFVAPYTGGEYSSWEISRGSIYLYIQSAKVTPRCLFDGIADSADDTEMLIRSF